MDCLADQIHADRCADRCNVKCAKSLDHIRQRRDNILFCDDDFRMLASNVVGHFFCIFQINSVLAHADGKGADGPVGAFLRHRAHQRGVQTAAEEEANLGVGHQTLFDAGDQLFPDCCAHGIQIVPAHLLDGGDVPVADKFSILVVVSRRKRHDLLTEPHQVFGLTGKDDGPGGVVTVVERTDTDGVPGGDIAFGISVV